MTKSIWVNVIKNHTDYDKEKTYIINGFNANASDDECAFLEVLVTDVFQDMDRGSSIYSGFKAQRVNMDSDDFLILYRRVNWGQKGRDIISYVLWQDIRSIKFYTAQKEIKKYND